MSVDSNPRTLRRRTGDSVAPLMLRGICSFLGLFFLLFLFTDLMLKIAFMRSKGENYNTINTLLALYIDNISIF